MTGVNFFGTPMWGIDIKAASATMLGLMRPSSRLFLDPDIIFEDGRARQRARWLYGEVSREVRSSAELKGRLADSESAGGQVDALTPESQRTGPFPGLWRRSQETREEWRQDRRLRLIAEVADSYPRLLVWLAEGRVSRYWNVFGIWVAFLRSIPGVRRLVWLIIFKPVAGHAPWRPALREAILQKVRYELNGRAGKTGGRLEISDHTPGLSAVTDMAMVAPPGVRRNLRSRIEKMSSGCIGVTGLRGAGKSTLIRDFCSHRYGTPVWAPGYVTRLPGLRVEVRAPCQYDAREFLVHLYTCLCRAVLADMRLNPTSFVHRIVLSLLLPRSVRLVPLLRSLAGIALLVLAGGLAYRAVVGNWPVPSWRVQIWEWLGVVAACVAAVIVTGWRTRQALIEVRQILTLATDAQARLEKLHFQRTDTRGYAGNLAGPMGTALNISGGRSLTEQMMTMPELIDDYRDFVERVVAALQQVSSARNRKHKRSELGADSKGHAGDRPGPGEPRPNEDDADIRLIIGIDEMDRIEDARGAHRFLAELKPVFGTSNCVYLISVSPGTLAAADELDGRTRNSATSVFDEMVWVEQLSLARARILLAHRVIGLQPTFIALCYVMSGGLPRDLLRIARTMSTIHGGESRAGLKLADVAEDVITVELNGFTHRAMAHAASLEIPATPDLLELLTDSHRPLSHPGVPGHVSRPVDITKAMNDLSQLWAGRRRQRFADSGGDISPRTVEICDSFLASLYFLLTVRQLFTAEARQIAMLAAAEARNGTSTPGEGPLRGLARARAALDVNPYLSARIISGVRQELSSHHGWTKIFAAIDPVFLRPLQELEATAEKCTPSARETAHSGEPYQPGDEDPGVVVEDGQTGNP